MELTIKQISEETAMPQELVPLQLRSIKVLIKLGKFEDTDEQVLDNLNKNWYFYSKKFARESR